LTSAATTFIVAASPSTRLKTAGELGGKVATAMAERVFRRIRMSGQRRAVSILDISLGTAIGALVIAVVTMMMTTPAAQAQTFRVVHSFTGGADGANPGSGLTLDRGGHLYGTASRGGSPGVCQYPGGCGTVYRMTPHESNWVFGPLYTFTGSLNDGGYPESGVTVGPDGSLYGSTGLIYNLKPPESIPGSVFAPWTETLVYTFSYLPDGFGPSGNLAFDSAGNIYGTTEFGGRENGCGAGGLGCGSVYQLTKSNGSWTRTVLYKFEGASDGGQPIGGVIIDRSGNLYGTTPESFYGNFCCGAVFEVSPSGSGWTETTLGTFSFDTTGENSYSNLIFDPHGNLYGVGANGGANGGGTVVELTPSGGGWTLNPLNSFTCSPCGWASGPYGGLAMDSAGNLYGTTREEGAYNRGSVFKLTPSGGTWIYTDLHDFTGGSDGATPEGSLLVDSGGNVYGTTYAGGQTGASCDSGVSYQCGVVFEITP
jgi:uncharacterized repeat protein (TIGR03803 family)